MSAEPTYLNMGLAEAASWIRGGDCVSRFVEIGIVDCDDDEVRNPV